MSGMTREAWLLSAAKKIERLFTRIGLSYPKRMRISVGFPKGKARAGEKLGQCWSDVASGDGTVEVFVSPVLEDEMDVLGVLVHELLHACLGTEAGHGPAFKKAALAIGLEGKMTATTVGPVLRVALHPIIENRLPPYPHATLNSENASKKDPETQSTRMIKVTCPSKGCLDEKGKPYLVRMSRKWIESKGTPGCPCGETMVAELPEDEGSDGE